jgi:hypothetical protein
MSGQDISLKNSIIKDQIGQVYLFIYRGELAVFPPKFLSNVII